MQLQLRNRRTTLSFATVALLNSLARAKNDLGPRALKFKGGAQSPQINTGMEPRYERGQREIDQIRLGSFRPKENPLGGFTGLHRAPLNKGFPPSSDNYLYRTIKNLYKKWMDHLSSSGLSELSCQIQSIQLPLKNNF